MYNMETNGNSMINKRCTLHFKLDCTVCLLNYDGSYSLDINNPFHQLIISEYLEKSRVKNNMEELYRQRYLKKRKLRKQSEKDSHLKTPEKVVEVISAKTKNFPNNAYLHFMSCNSEPGTSMTREPLGVRMAGGSSGMLAARVNRNSIGRNGVPCISASGSGEFSVSAIQWPSSEFNRSGVGSIGSAQAVKISSTSYPPTATHSSISSVNQPAYDGARITDYFAEQGSLPSISVLSSPESGRKSVNSSASTQLGKVDMMELSDDTTLLREVSNYVPHLELSEATQEINLIGAPIRSSPSTLALEHSFFKKRPESKDGSPQLVEALIAKRLLHSAKRSAKVHILPSVRNETGISLTATKQPQFKEPVTSNENVMRCLKRHIGSRTHGSSSYHWPEKKVESLLSREISLMGVRKDLKLDMVFILQLFMNENGILSPFSILSSPSLPSVNTNAAQTAPLAPQNDVDMLHGDPHRAPGLAKRRRMSQPVHKTDHLHGSKPHFHRPWENSNTLVRVPENYEKLVIKCENEAFLVETRDLELSSTVLKDTVKKCCVWVPRKDQRQKYRGLSIVGVPPWALEEVLRFISGNAYNHHVMKSDDMKRWLNMLGIKYWTNENFILPVLKR